MSYVCTQKKDILLFAIASSVICASANFVMLFFPLVIYEIYQYRLDYSVERVISAFHIAGSLSLVVFFIFFSTSVMWAILKIRSAVRKAGLTFRQMSSLTEGERHRLEQEHSLRLADILKNPKKLL